MTPPESLGDPTKLSDAEKAKWAVAYAMQTRTRQLSPALRKAYGDYEVREVCDLEALADARRWARSIHSALVEACKLAGVA